MILDFLRLFSTFRAIERGNQVLRDTINQDTALLEHDRLLAAEREKAHKFELLTEVNRREIAEAESAFWRARSEEWEKRYLEANSGAILARETMADFLSQLRFGRKIFAHAPALAEKPVDEMKPIPKQRVQARVLVQRGEAKFDQEMAEYIRKRRAEIQAEVEAARRPPAGPEPAPAAETTP